MFRKRQIYCIFRFVSEDFIVAFSTY